MREVILKSYEFRTLTEEVLSRGGSFSFRAHGYSMVPFIQDGDILTVEPIKASDLDIGTVALYRLGEDKLVAHRIVNKEMVGEQEFLIMRGDATSGSNDKIQAEQVLGRIACIQRGKGFVRLERCVRRLTALHWIKATPIGLLLFRPVKTGTNTLARCLLMFQTLKLYRVLARILIGKNVRYRIATIEDSPSLSKLYGGYKGFFRLAILLER